MINSRTHVLYFLFLCLVNSQNCGTFTTCTTCLQNAACGWCPKLNPQKNACIPGTQRGPLSNETCHWWRYKDTNTCVNEDACLPFTSCGNCTQQMNCGWCGSACLTGDARGPFDRIANCTSWMWKTEVCEEPNCGLFKTCSACIKQKYPPDEPESGCGWCDNKECRNGRSKGASTYHCEQWTWNQCNCTDAPTRNVHITDRNVNEHVIDIGKDTQLVTVPSCASCDVYKDCKSCTEDASTLCGWCDDTKKCLQVGTQKSSTNQCLDWRYGTCQKSCYSITDCYECTKLEYCGMCSSFCTLGNVSGPQFFPSQFCSPWSHGFVNCDLQRCSTLSTCSTCTSQGCHWCPGFGCKSAFGLGCCDSCSACADIIGPAYPSQLLTVSIGILVGLATIIGGMFLFSASYAFWKYYWLRRHYFEVLQ